MVLCPLLVGRIRLWLMAALGRIGTDHIPMKLFYYFVSIWLCFRARLCATARKKHIKTDLRLRFGLISCPPFLKYANEHWFLSHPNNSIRADIKTLKWNKWQYAPRILISLLEYMNNECDEWLTERQTAPHTQHKWSSHRNCCKDNENNSNRTTSIAATKQTKKAKRKTKQKAK